MFKIKGQNLYLTRGDAMSLQLSLSNDEKFSVGDTIKISIVEKNDYSSVVFSKSFRISQETQTAEIYLTPAETKIGDPIKTGYVVYWYEIELNNSITLIGFDNEGPKLFVLWPEAGTE